MHYSHNKEFTLGIYGDGQLARLLALKAREADISTLIYTLNELESPCRDLAPLQQGKSWTDQESFINFCQKCDTIVLENEFVPAEYLLNASEQGVRIFPSAKSFDQVSNKLKQVELARSLGINIPEYKVIQSSQDITQVNLPVMLKSLTGGYDGYGNFTLENADQLDGARAFIEKCGPTLAQEFIDFDMEVAIIVASDGKNIFSFPVVETIQEKNICHFVLSPPRLSQNIQDEIAKQAKSFIQKIKGIGVYGVEFFIKGETVIFNEVAPRTHNSGHYSIEACDYSQFDALITLIQNQKLTPPRLKVPVVGMLNLLGTQNGKAHFKGDDKFHHNSQGFLHLYGKSDSRIGRKMGHYTLLGQTTDSVLEELKYLKTRYEL